MFSRRSIEEIIATSTRTNNGVDEEHWELISDLQSSPGRNKMI
jgi:hypothetical protein